MPDLYPYNPSLLSDSTRTGTLWYNPAPKRLGVLKNAIVALFLLLMVSSCGIYQEPDPLTGLPTVTSIGEAWRIAASVKYVSDGNNNYCRQPAETYKLRIGDCEDITTLFVALVKSMGYKAYVVLVIEDGGYHTVAKVDGVYMEPQIYGRYLTTASLHIVKEYELEDALIYIRSIY